MRVFLIDPILVVIYHTDFMLIPIEGLPWPTSCVRIGFYQNNMHKLSTEQSNFECSDNVICPVLNWVSILADRMFIVLE